MNSKQRRAERRKGLISKLDKIIIKRRVGANCPPPSHSVEEMNDFCPLIYEKCGNKRQEYSWLCFGRYESCPFYKNRKV